MKKIISLFSTLPFIFIFLIVSCAPPPTTSPDMRPSELTIILPTAWKDENYQGERFKKVFIIAALQDPVFKRLCEDEFVRQLAAHGTDSVASYSVYLTHFISDKESVTAKIKQAQADALLIARLMKTDRAAQDVLQEKFVLPPWYYDWYEYYSSGFGLSQSPSYRDQNFRIITETTFYDTKEQKLLWFARSEILEVPCVRCQDITAPIKFIVERMSSDRLIESQ